MKKKYICKMLVFLISIIFISYSFVPALQIRTNNYISTYEERADEDFIFDLKVKILMKIAHIPSLSAGIIKENELIWYKGYGLYDSERLPNKDTIYLIGSTTKSFTATAIMQLYDQGRIDLDEDVNQYLDFNLRNPKYPEISITFRMILAHQSSLGFYGESVKEFWDQDFDFSEISIEKYLKDCFLGEEKDLYWKDYPPGEDQTYSNIGFALLGYLVERVTGESFDRYCMDNIFVPLNMSNTSFNVSELNQRNIAIPYIWYDFGFKLYQGWLPQYHYTGSIYPAGFLRTSVEDLSHFLIAFINGGVYKNSRILKQSYVEEMHKIQYPQNKKSLLGMENGLGWHIWEKNGNTIKVGHGGDTIGCHSNMWIRRKDNIGVIYFTNIQLNKDFRGMFVRQALEPLFFNKADKL